MKKANVSMTVVLKDGEEIDEIKRWEHHIEYAMNLDEYPEIAYVEDVKVIEM